MLVSLPGRERVHVEARPVHCAARCVFVASPSHSRRKDDCRSSLQRKGSHLQYGSSGSSSEQARMHVNEPTSQRSSCYCTAPDRLSPASGNPGAMATTLSGHRGITPGPVCVLLPASGDYPCAGQVAPTTPWRTPASHGADTGAIPELRGTREVRGSGGSLVARAVADLAGLGRTGGTGGPAM